MNTVNLSSSQVQTSPAYRGLYGPWADVLLLGGGSVLAMLVLMSLTFTNTELARLSVVMLVLANFVNHPHFAFSYQMFYGAWSDVRGGKMSADLRRRWWIAGVVAPVALALFLAAGALLWLHGHPVPLGLGLTLMGLLVGWHYVKQGFGMAMMDAALKKRYWPAATREAMLMNAYAIWGVAWLVGASITINRNFWGISGINFSLHGAVAIVACIVAVSTTIWCTLAVWRTVQDWRRQQLGWKDMPLAGLVAYVITLYVWMGLVFTNAAFALTIPFFHSLQYMTVVGRYKLNENKAAQGGVKGLVRFVVVGALLGAAGFWLLPGLLDYARTGHIPAYGVGVALAIGCAWLFINVHHYLIDNVLWRQGNPNVKQHLFDYPHG